MIKKAICTDIYTVKEGDSLYSIGKKYDVSICDLMMANKIINPYKLTIGSKLCIPGEIPQNCSGVIHTVEKGDTLYMISKMHKVSLNDLLKANPDLDPYDMKVGTKLCIPV